MRPPRKYQVDPIKRLRTLDSALVFVPPRGGKSKMVVDALRKGNRLPRTLVVCPLTVIGAWQNELADEGITNRIVLIRGTRKQKIALMKTAGPVVFLTNYETLITMRNHAALFLADCEAVVLDESTRVKHCRTKTAKAAAGSLRGIPRRFVLTGTPTPESLLDLWQQVDFVAPNLFARRNGSGMSFFEWRETYFYADYWGTKWTPYPDTEEKLMKAIASIVVTVDRKDLGLAPEEDVSISLPLTPEARRVYDDLAKSFTLTLDEHRWESNYVVAIIEKLSQICSGFLTLGSHTRAKTRRTQPIAEDIDAVLLRAVPDVLKQRTIRFPQNPKRLWLADFLRKHRGESVVVWFRHTLVGEEIAKCFRHAPTSWGMINRNTPRETRREILKRFESGNPRVLAAQVDIAKFGVEALTRNVVFFEPTWSFEAYYQARERAQAPVPEGAKPEDHTIRYYLLTTRNTVEETFYATLGKKGGLHEEFHRAMLEKRHGTL